VDVLGLIIDVSDSETVKLKFNREKVRKYLTLVDETSYSIVVTLWGDICEKSVLSAGDIIGISGARISDYGGKSLNAASDHADLTINPNHERARKLSFWYNDLIQKYGGDAVNKIRSLTNKMKSQELPESRMNFNNEGGGSMQLTSNSSG
jgi:ssDNA-binding replication factor A large subunit